MATKTYTSGGVFYVPDDNTSITVTCYGGKGEAGSTSVDSGVASDSLDGESGGVVTAEIPTSPGTKYIIDISGGGNSDSGSLSCGHGSVSPGGGGDAADIREDNSVSSVIIGAGGGGGGPAAASHHHDGGVDTTSIAVPGSGGGEATNSGSTSNTTEAIGGGSSSRSGQDAGVSTLEDNVRYTACGRGGGGSGYNGGERGEVYHYNINQVVAEATGGAGGDGFVSGDHNLSNVSSSVGSHSGSAKVEIQYTPKPLPVDTISHSFKAEVAQATIEWEHETTIADGYYVYRNQSGTSTDPNDRIATINDPNTKTYTDSGVSRGQRYYYTITAFDSDSGNESDSATSMIDVFVAAKLQHRHDQGFWSPKPVKIWDDTNRVWIYPKAVKVWDETNNQWVIVSNLNDVDNPFIP